MIQLDENAIYRTRGGREVGLVLLRLITPKRFNVLVQYEPANRSMKHAEPQLGLVDWRGFVFGSQQHDDRDLITFIEYNEESYYQ